MYLSIHSTFYVRGIIFPRSSKQAVICHACDVPVHSFVGAFGQAAFFFAIRMNNAMFDAGILDKTFDHFVDELGSIVVDFLGGAADRACPVLQRSKG